MNIKVTIYDDEGEEVEYLLPARYEVCFRCRGEGRHCNPSIDGNGITGSEMAEILNEDPNFLEDYVGGKYDVVCRECDGLRVISEVDEEHLSEDQKKIYDLWCRQEGERAQGEAEDRMYQRMESGYYSGY